MKKSLFSLIFILIFAMSAYGATITKGTIGAQDIHQWAGTTADKTFTRPTSTGGTITLNAFGYVVDVLNVYGGGVRYTDATITAALTAIGTSNKVLIVFAPGTWTFSASKDWSSYTNVIFYFHAGAIITHGTYTLKMPVPVAGNYQIFTPANTGAETFYGAGDGINPCWWGAVAGDSDANDDGAAFTKAIAASKASSLVTTNASVIPVVVPAGRFVFNTIVNATNFVGATVKGSGSSRYQSTYILGNTSGAIFDFSGSATFRLEGIRMESVTASGATRSTIGVLAARTSSGGTVYTIKDCHIQLDDYAAANGGAGSVGLMNIAFENGFIEGSHIVANLPAIFSYKTALSVTDLSISTTVTSSYATLTATASMGDTTIVGTPLQSVQKRMPAILLGNANSFRFTGYLGRTTQTAGSNEVAVWGNGANDNIHINATVEGFSTMFRQDSSTIHGLWMDLVSANNNDTSKPFIDYTGITVVSGVRNNYITIQDMDAVYSRYFVYATPISSGDAPQTMTIYNSSYSWQGQSNPTYMITADLLKQCGDVKFNAGFSFEKTYGGWVRNYYAAGGLGTVGTVAANNVALISPADKTTTASNNGGSYSVRLTGQLTAGSLTSGDLLTQDFSALMTLVQTSDGTKATAGSNVTLGSISSSNFTAINCTNIDVAINVASNSGSVLYVQVTPTMSGTANTAAVSFIGYTEVKTNFLVKDSIPYAPE